MLTTRAYETAARRLAELSGGRLAAVGGGGYDVAATPRIWALELTTLLGLPAPADWRDPPGAVGPPPAAMRARIREGARATVETVRRLVFPVHGLP
jgi:hypothetical protein